MPNPDPVTGKLPLDPPEKYPQVNPLKEKHTQDPFPKHPQPHPEPQLKPKPKSPGYTK